MNQKNILLTGGSGFIGKNIRESFLSEKYNILAPSSKELNCADDKSVDDFFAQHEIYLVIHSAVKPGHRNAKDFTDLFLTNSKMFYNLERHSRRYEKMLVTGSGAIYDMRRAISKVKEENYGDHIPTDEHGFCKYVTGRTIEQSRNIYDLRIFSIFGKYEDYAIRFISNVICKIIFDLPITIKQNRLFDFLYVQDLNAILDWFITHEPQYLAYNITPDKAISLYEVADIVRKTAGKPDHPIIIAREGMAPEYSGSNARLRAEMPSLTLTPIEKAISELYAWYVENKNNIDKNLLLIDK
ncbi:MAG: NAD(P)-dependent oxidoreductase [Bacteroidales bacterium]|jgi:GDP-L-fucose synthase|nr:NAD(P)-dependent oxidoreductase [Bacteroidales bacterium]